MIVYTLCRRAVEPLSREPFKVGTVFALSEMLNKMNRLLKIIIS